jgi:hypothetical protein
MSHPGACEALRRACGANEPNQNHMLVSSDMLEKAFRLNLSGRNSTAC